MGVSATAWGVPDPEQRTKSCLRAAGPCPWPHHHLKWTGCWFAYHPSKPEIPYLKINQKQEGEKFLPEGAKKVTTWMNGTGLKTPGAGGFSLKSEKEKSKIFFVCLTWQRLYATVVQRTAQTRFGEGFIERGRFRVGQQALAWWRVAGGGDGAGGGGADGGGAGDKAASRRRERCGAGRSRVSSRGPSAGLPLPAPHPLPPPPRPAACEAHPPAFALPHGHTPASRVHAASPRRPAHARPLGADARRPGLLWAMRKGRGAVA